MPASSPAPKMPIATPVAAPVLATEHALPTATYGYSDEAPFGDVVKDPTPVPTKATDGENEGGEDAPA